MRELIRVTVVAVLSALSRCKVLPTVGAARMNGNPIACEVFA